MGLLVDAVYIAAAAVTSPVWAWRMLRAGKHRTDWPARFGRTLSPPPGDDRRPTLLLHAVSVGEINAIRLLVDRLAARTAEVDPAGRGWRLVISATTDTGLARARTLFEPAHQVVRFPFDFSSAMRRLLDAVKPDLAASVELDLWPNFIEQCTRRGVPVCIVNGRLSERSHRGYRLLGPLVRPTFARLSAVGAQSPAIADRFADVGVPKARITVTDTMKWDTAEIADHVDGAEALAHAMGLDRQRPLIVAGSTGPGEEKQLIDACPPQVQLLIAPRKPERFDEVAALQPNIVRRTRCADAPPGDARAGDARAGDGRGPDEAGRPRVFLLDTLGELRKAYALADIVIVGRSFVPLGGSDMMEPIALGKPTITGPHTKNFAHIMEALTEAGGVLVTDQPGEAIARLLSGPSAARDMAQRGRQVIIDHQGATDRTVELLMSMMPAAAQR